MLFSRFSGAFILSLSLFTSSVSAEVLERLEASVNSDTILKSDLTKFRKNLQLRAQLDPLFAGTEIASKGPAASDSEIVEFLIDERLIVQAFPLTDAEVEQEVTTIQANNNITREQLRSALLTQGFRFEDYFELIRVGAAKRNLIDREIRTRVSISNDDIRNYYLNHYNRGKELPKAYQLRIITTKTRNAAEEAVKMIQAGESFEEVAKNVSQDPSAEQGGELPLLSEEQLSPLIRDQVKRLQVGQTSPIFAAGQSQFALLKLVDVKSSAESQIKELEAEIRSALATTEYQRQLQLWLERRRQEAFIHKHGQSITENLIQK